MARKQRNNIGNNRRGSADYFDEDSHRVVKEKFAQSREASAPSKGIEFNPRTDNQKRFLRYMREGRKLVWGIGRKTMPLLLVAGFVGFFVVAPLGVVFSQSVRNAVVSQREKSLKE